MKPPRTPDSLTPTGILNHLQQLNKVMSNVTFGSTLSNADAEQNIDCWKATGTSAGVADTEFSVVHRLGRIPITIAGQDTNNGGLLYRSTTAWTKTTVFLKCTKATSVFNVVLI